MKIKKLKRAAETEIKTARKITEFLKPKPEHPSISNNIENNKPDAAVAGISTYKLGSGNETFSGEKGKPDDLLDSKVGKTLNLPRGLVVADCDWPDGTRRTRLSQSE